MKTRNLRRGSKIVLPRQDVNGDGSRIEPRQRCIFLGRDDKGFDTIIVEVIEADRDDEHDDGLREMEYDPQREWQTWR